MSKVAKKQLENVLKMQTEQLRNTNAESGLLAEKGLLETIANNLPDTALFRLVRTLDTEKFYMEYVSANWKEITGLTPESVVEDIKPLFNVTIEEDVKYLWDAIDLSMNNLNSNFRIDVRINKNGATCWLVIAAYPYKNENTIIWDGIIRDLTSRKNIEEELAIHRNNLELLVQERTNDITTANEELATANEELAATNEELCKYKTKLESMVEQRTQELHVSMERLETISNNIPDSVLYCFEMDVETKQMRFTYLGANWEKISGTSVKDALANISVVLSALHPDDRQSVLDKYFETARTMEKYHHEVRFIAHGKTGWFRILATPKREGNLTIWDGIFIVITQEKQMEIELKAEKERLETISNDLTDTVLYRIVRDLDSGKTWMDYVNANWETIMGITPQQVAESMKPFEDAIHPKDEQFFHNSIYNSMVNLEDIKMEVRFKKNGKTIWLAITSNPNKVGNTIVWNGTMKDITSRKNIEYELAAYREDLEQTVQERTNELTAANEELAAINEELYRYKTKLEDMVEHRTSELRTNKEYLLALSRRQNVLISVLQIIQTEENIDDTIDLSIAEIGKYFNVSRVSIIEKNDDEATMNCNYSWCNADVAPIKHHLQNIPIEYVQRQFACIQKRGMFCTSDVRAYEFETTRFLEKYDIKSFISMPLTINGTHYGLISLDECAYNREWERDDINLIKSLSHIISTATRRHRVEKDLVIAMEKAEESNKLKSAFLANMSHEIRTPLNGIIGFSNFINTNDISPKERAKYVNIIKNSSQQLSTIIDDIIDISKIDTNQLSIIPIPTELNKLLVELWDFYTAATLLMDNKQNLELVFDSEFKTQPTILIDQVRLRQILYNLVGNAIKYTDKGYVHFGYRISMPDMLEFSVHDSGVGIPADQLGFIFDRFRKVEMSNDRQYGGTGLGLTISRHLVQMMGGEIWVESTEGEGSSFYFTVPYVPVV